MKLVKGSLQAKRYMASIRAKKSINGVKEKGFYILFLNKDKNFTKDKKYFDSYNEAIIWGKKNFERFNTDMIYNNSKKIGKTLGAELPATITIGSLLRKAKINGLPINFQASFRGQPFYIVNQYDIYGNVVLELMDKKTNVKFGTITNNSKTDFVVDEFILWLSSKGVNFYTDKEIKEIHKQIKPLAVNLVKEVKDFNKGTKQPKVKKQVVKKAKVQRLRPTKVSSKTSILKESNLIKQRLKEKKMIMPHGYQVKRSVLNGVVLSTEEKKFLINEGKKSKGFNYRAKVIWGDTVVLKEKENGQPVQKFIVDNYELADYLCKELNKNKNFTKVKGKTI